jgi:hypothetical protein
VGPVDLTPVVKGIQVGVDVGQRQDPSAVVVTEVQLRDYSVARPALSADQDRETYERALVAGGPYPPARHVTGGELYYVVRTLGRLPLGTPYPAVAERLVSLCEQLAPRGQVTVYVDATGVGQPVVDLLEAAGVENLFAVYLTGGEREHREDREIKLPKMMLVSRMKVLLQTGRVLLPKTPEAETLKIELQNFETRFTDAANLQFGAFKVGAHDDLAVALGLACRAPAGASNTESQVSVGNGDVREMFE